MPTLLDMIPSADAVTGLIGQAGEKFSATTSSLSLLPTASLGQLSVKLDIELPDLSAALATTTSALANVLGDLPDPAALVEPLSAAFEGLSTIASFTINAEVNEAANKIFADLKSRPADLQALVSLLSGPLAEIQKLIELPQIGALLSSLFRLSGSGDAGEISEAIKSMGKSFQQIMEGGIGNTISCVMPLFAVESFGLRMETWAGAMGGQISAEGINKAFNELMIQCGGEAETGLAARIKNADLSDPGQVQALVLELRQVQGAFVSFAQSFGQGLSGLDGCAAAFDADRFQAKIEKIAAPLAKADLSAINDIATKVKGLLLKLTKALGEMDKSIDLAKLKGLLSSGMKELTARLEAFDMSGLAQGLQQPLDEMLRIFDEIQDLQVKIALKVGGFFQSVRDRIATINLEVVTQPVASCLDRIDGVLGELAELVTLIRSALEGVMTAIKDALKEVDDFVKNPSTGLKTQLEGALIPIRDAIKGLDIEGVFKEVNDKITAMVSNLDQVSFDGVIDPVVQELEDLAATLKEVDLSTLPEMMQMALAAALQVIKGFKFEVEITDKLAGEIDVLKGAVTEKTLAPFGEMYHGVTDKLTAFNPAVLVTQGLREAAYLPVSAKLMEVRPGELLKEAEDKLAAAIARLEAFRPGLLLTPVQGAFDDLLATFQTASPTALVDDLEKLLTAAREKITAVFTIDAWVTKLRDMVAPLEKLLSETEVAQLLDKGEAVFAQIATQLERLDAARLTKPIAGPLAAVTRRMGLPLSAPGLAATIKRMLTEANADLGDQLQIKVFAGIDQAMAELAAIDLPAMTITAQKAHAGLNAALSIHGAGVAGYAEIDVQLKSLDCLPTLATLSAAYDKASGRLAAIKGSVHDALAGAKQSLEKINAVQKALKEALAGLTPLAEIFLQVAPTLFPDLAPVTWTGFVKALVRELDPAQFRQDLLALFTALKVKAMLLTGPDGIVTAIETAMNEVKARLESLSVVFLREALEGVFNEVEAKIKELDPGQTTAALDAKYQQVLDALKDIGLDGMGQELNQVYEEEVLKVLADLDPATLLEPSLSAIYNEIVDLLGIIDVEKVFEPLVTKLDEVSITLKSGLGRAEVAFNAMLNAVPAGGSVSVSVSVG